MAELVDALDLGSSAARREGSSPFVRIGKLVEGTAIAPRINLQRRDRLTDALNPDGETAPAIHPEDGG